MPKSSNQKIRTLYLIQIPLKETGENHILNTLPLLRMPKGYEVRTEHKTICDDMQTTAPVWSGSRLPQGKAVGLFCGQPQRQVTATGR